MLRVSIIVLLVGFLPLYVVQIFKRSVKSKVNPAYIIMLLVGISIVLILSRVNISKDGIDRYTDMAMQFEEATLGVNRQTGNMIASYGDSVVTADMKKVISMTDAIELLAEQMMNGLINAVGQEGVVIDEVEGRDKRNVASKAYLENGLAMEFIENCREYKEYLISIVDDPVLEKQIEIALMFSDGHWASGWDPQDYAKEPLVVNYFKIAQLRYQVIVVENRVIELLLDER